MSIVFEEKVTATSRREKKKTYVIYIYLIRWQHNIQNQSLKFWWRMGYLLEAVKKEN